MRRSYLCGSISSRSSSTFLASNSLTKFSTVMKFVLRCMFLCSCDFVDIAVQSSANEEKTTVRVVAEKGNKAVTPRPPNSAGHVSFVPIICADPNVEIPSAWIFACQKFMQNYVSDGEPGCLGVCTKKGSNEQLVCSLTPFFFSCLVFFLTLCFCSLDSGLCRYSGAHGCHAA